MYLTYTTFSKTVKTDTVPMARYLGKSSIINNYIFSYVYVGNLPDNCVVCEYFFNILIISVSNLLIIMSIFIHKYLQILLVT